MMERVDCVVSGRVQFVMYRDYVQRKAKKLGICGFVYNNGDGTVSVVAEGERATLETFIQQLHRGSLFARVTKVVADWKEYKNEFNRFWIKY